MAKDPNSSDNQSVNELPGFSDIERIGRRASTRSAEDRADRQRLQRQQEIREGLEQAIDERPAIANVPFIRKELGRARETALKLGPRVRLRAESRYDRAVEETRNAVEREFSGRAINGQATDYASSEIAQQRGLGMLNVPYGELQNQRKSVMNDLGKLGRQSINLAENDLYNREGEQDPSAKESLRGLYRRRKTLVDRLGVITAAEQHQRAEGLDPKSQYNDLMRIGQSANSILKRDAVSQELQSGNGLGALSMSDLKKKEVEAAHGVADALNKLKNAANESAETVEKLKSEAGDAAETLGKVQEAIKQGGGSGGGGHNLQFYGAMASATGNLASTLLLNQPLQALQNKSGFASMSNQVYDSRKRALSGNMQDLTLLGSDAFSNAQSSGNSAHLTSQIATGLNTVGAGIQGGLGIAASIESGGLAGTGAAIQGVSGAAAGIGDLYSGASAGSANLAFQQSNLALDRERAYVTADMRQNLYNHAMGGRKAALAGGGAGGRNFFEANIAGGAGSSIPMLSPMQRMENAGIGTEQFSQLAAQGFSQQGSQFNAEQIFTARRMERNGMADMGTTMGRMGALAGAGANNPQAGLQSVMEAAFSKSLDGSKALNMMVENTAAMAQQSVGTSVGGLDTIKGSASIISNLVDPSTNNKEAAITAAMSAAQKLNSINSGTSANFADMYGVSAIASNAGIDSLTAKNIKGMSDSDAATIRLKMAEMEKIKKSNPNQYAKDMTTFSHDMSNVYGLGELEGKNGFTDTARLSKALDIRGNSALNDGIFTSTVNSGAKGYNQYINHTLPSGWKNLPEYATLRKQTDRAAAAIHLTGDQLEKRGGFGLDTSKGAAEYQSGMSGGQTSESQKNADNIATAQYKEMTKEARVAAEQLGGVAEALKAINKATEGLGDKLSSGSSEDFRKAASKAAEDFSNGAKVFTAGVTDFGKYVNVLAGRAASGSDNKNAKR
jgi:hypothetical protein